MKQRIITARIDDQSFYQIEYLKKEIGLSNTTKILTYAIQNLYDSLKEKNQKKSPFELLEDLDLIGSISEEPKLSQNYKAAIHSYLDKKYPKKTRQKRKNAK